MSSSVEPEKVGPSCDDPKCVAKTTQLEAKSSTTVDHTSEFARILAKNVTLTPLSAISEAECILAEVEKLTTNLEAYPQNKPIAECVHRAAVVLMNFVKNYFAIDNPDSHAINGFKMVMEYCNQLEGWFDSIREFNSERTTYPGWICYRYEAKLDKLIRFEYRSFGFDHDCADTLKCMMADYISRARAAAWKEKNNRCIEIALHDAVMFLCDKLVYFIEHRLNKKVKPKDKPKVPVNDSSDDSSDYSDDDILTEFYDHGWEIWEIVWRSKDESEDESDDEPDDKPKVKPNDEGSCRIRILTSPKDESRGRH